MTGHTTADVLRRVLSAGGVGSLYGRALPGFEVAAVADPLVAVLLAQAHCAIGGTRAVAHLGDGTFVVPGRGADGPVRTLRRQHVEVSDAATLFGLAPAIEEAARGAGLEIQLDLDLSAPSTDGPVERPASTADWLDDDALGEIPTLGTVVVLAGPGVVQDAAVGGLRALAAAGRLGVLNTWGAKGVFHWQSRHHWATVGLQEHDFELGGLGSADLVLVTGVDEREAPPQSWAQFPHRIVAPGALAPLAERWPDGGSFPELPPLRPRLAAVTQAGWAATGVPLMPSLVTQHYARVLGDGGFVAADAGTAGYWVARTFATTRLGSVNVPAAPFQGGRRPVPPWHGWPRRYGRCSPWWTGRSTARPRQCWTRRVLSGRRSASRPGRPMARRPDQTSIFLDLIPSSAQVASRRCRPICGSWTRWWPWPVRCARGYQVDLAVERSGVRDRKGTEDAAVRG